MAQTELNFRTLPYSAAVHLAFCNFFFLIFSPPPRPRSRHMEVPRLGVELEL